jgi:hypothetical protein
MPSEAGIIVEWRHISDETSDGGRLSGSVFRNRRRYRCNDGAFRSSASNFNRTISRTRKNSLLLTTPLAP